MIALLALLLALAPRPARADEGWVIRSFDATYVIQKDGSVDVTEDIRVDFGTQQHHGITRDIPVEYDFDAKHHRVIQVAVQSVDDGVNTVPYTASRNGANYSLRIGDPDHTVSGPQRYRITYHVTGALNPQAGSDVDEFYWNVTGNDTTVTTGSASAVVAAPQISQYRCFEGTTGSNLACKSTPLAAGRIQFATTSELKAGEGLTVVAGLPKGTVTVPPLQLVEVKSTWEQIRDFLGLKPLPIALAILVAIGAFGAVLRYWWLAGRDSWFGDVHYLTGDTRERRRPLFAKDTVVVEYTPPEIGRNKRRLRPAEIGTLLDERADTLDVTATIVDLAVRGYLRITEVPKKWAFGSVDYKLERLKDADSDLLEYEKLLHEKLFDDGATVNMSDLRNEFYTDLAKVKKSLYTQVVSTDRFFPSNPETVRTWNLVAAVVLTALGFFALGVLGALGAGLIGLAIMLAGLLMLALSRSMARRTADGREMYRRCLGFRLYMTVAEKDRQKFYEEADIFEKYLPYAIVYGCVERWAKVFQDLGIETTTSGWYVGTGLFTAAAFSESMQSFSSSVSSAIASTPGGSGGSGFGGGGFSGGGVGGGGTGSW
jgi:uncharacterized membrane protein